MKPQGEFEARKDVEARHRRARHETPLAHRAHSKVALMYPSLAGDSLLRTLQVCSEVRVAPFTDCVVGTDWDVIIVDVAPGNLALVEYALREWDNLGTPEVVVAPSRPCASIESALAHFGIHYIMPLDVACSWIPQTIHSLAALARARRSEKTARSALAETPPPLRRNSPEIHPLFTAESSFREAYLRLLVARSATVREAAAAAGVPYRSFQRMLTTYGIHRATGPGHGNQGGDA